MHNLSKQQVEDCVGYLYFNVSTSVLQKPNDIYNYILCVRLLILVAIVTPWNIAFEHDELMDSRIFDPIIDISFAIDIILTFNTAIYKDDGDKNVLVNTRKQIAKNYVSGWFWLDLISCLPMEQLLDAGANELAKIMRVSKLQKLFKILRIPRFLKIFALKGRLQESYFSFYKSSISGHSIAFILALTGLFCHFSACTWVLITTATIDSTTPNWI